MFYCRWQPPVETAIYCDFVNYTSRNWKTTLGNNQRDAETRLGNETVERELVLQFRRLQGAIRPTRT